MAILIRPGELRICAALVCVAVAGFAFGVAPAKADLRVCNGSRNQVSIALGYRAEKGWQSEGWWVAPPNKCADIFQGNLNSRFFYLYVADDIGGGSWDGSVFMCTRDQSFTIYGVEDCLARGYERTGFLEIDTKNRVDWTLNLTDPALPDGSTAAPDNATAQPPDISSGTANSGPDPGAGPDQVQSTDAAPGVDTGGMD